MEKDQQISILDKWKKNPIGPIIFILFILAIIFIPKYFSKRNDCLQSIVYTPANETPGGRGSVYKIDSHYSVGLRDFKTQKEAMDYCMSKENIL